jgi:hypothetical protein
MSDWATEKVQAVKAQLGAEQQKLAGWIENRKLIEEQAPALWKEVRAQIVTLVEDFNVAFGKDAFLIVGKEPTQIDVRFTVRAPALQLLVWFEATTAPNALHCAYPGSKSREQNYRLKADTSGIVAFWSEGSFFTAESIAKSMLDGLLRDQ